MSGAALRIERAPDVIVVGGGIIGLATATELAQAGVVVDVIDTNHRDAATGASAGLLTPLSDSEDVEMLGIGRTSRDLWIDWAAALEETTTVDVCFRRCGSLLPIFSSADSARADQLRKLAGQLEEPIEELTADEIETLAPQIARATSGLFLPADATVDPQRMREALRRRLEQLQVPVHGRSILEVRPGDDGVDLVGAGWKVATGQVVLAAGAWGNGLIGVEVPVRPVRGQMISWDRLDWAPFPSIRTEGHYALWRNGRLLVGATREECGFDNQITEEGRLELITVGERLFPDLRWKAVDSHWSGLRPGSPDGRPLIGLLGHDNVLIASGHDRQGVLLAPWTAQHVVDLVTGSGIPTPRAVDPQRFLESA